MQRSRTPSRFANCTTPRSIKQLIGVRPDLVVEVRADVLAESDGPMLIHGLQEMHGLRLLVPKQESQRPDPGRLEARYQLFRQAS